jgi:hypothetical protein
VKKWIVIVLVLLLILSGCGAKPDVQTDVGNDHSQTETDQPQMVSLYDPNHQAEKATNGAVRAYLLGDGSYTGLMDFGGKLLVISQGGEMTLLQGELGEISATAATDLSESWGSTDLCTNGQSGAYYVSERNEVVLLNERLQVSARIPLPEDAQGKPLIQLKRSEIIYCTEGQIRAIQIQTGVSRMVRSHDAVMQELLGSFFDDSMLACMVVDRQGNQNILYLDAQTGQELDHKATWNRLQTYEKSYYLQMPQSEGGQVVFGKRDEEMMRLDAPEQQMFPAMAFQGAVGCTSSDTGLIVSYYDLETGLMTAQVTLAGHESLTDVVCDGNFLWLLADKTLYRWDIQKSPVQDETVYTSQMYTEEAPDAEGLAACRSRADALESRYGFTLELYRDAQENGSRFGAKTEYQTGPINQALDGMEKVLAKLPEGFLGITGDIRVSLVRSLEDNKVSEVYWKGGACHIILAGTDIEEDLMLAIGAAVDTRVLGNSFDYDTWDDLNPWWFDYTYDYEENLNRNNPENCLEGSNRYFTDEIAMSFPTEDRARLFANALMEDNGEMFEASPIQKKLRAVCIAIREAYDYRKGTQIFTWEQYLKKPIAPSK